MKYKKLNEGQHMHVLVLGLSITALVLAFTLFVSTSASALAGPSFNSGQQLNASECNMEGKAIINVTQKIANTVDSGQGGNFWAYDNLNRHIQVWQNSDSEYCALVQYEGKFDSQAGQKSPGNTGILTGKEDGNFRGGYRGKITGALRSNPGYKTNGSIGTVDYNCDIGGNCPGAVNWLGEYFGPGYALSYEWWGWTYRYKNNTWVNSSDGNSGDII